MYFIPVWLALAVEATFAIFAARFLLLAARYNQVGNQREGLISMAYGAVSLALFLGGMWVLLSQSRLQ